MWLDQQGTEDLVTFTEEILNGKLNILSSDSMRVQGHMVFVNFEVTLRIFQLMPGLTMQQSYGVINSEWSDLF